VKPAYNGTPRSRIFSVTGRFSLLQVFEVKLKILKSESFGLKRGFRSIQVPFKTVLTVTGTNGRNQALAGAARITVKLCELSGALEQRRGPLEIRWMPSGSLRPTLRKPQAGLQALYFSSTSIYDCTFNPPKPQVIMHKF
jgi:hypothetical protein